MHLEKSTSASLFLHRVSAPLREILFVCALTSCTSGSVHAENWDRFRGPNGAGQSDADKIPSQWQADDILWKRPLPGIGHSSPVIWDDRLYTMSADAKTGEQIVSAFDAFTGAPRWERRFLASVYKKNNLNSFASSTPALDAQHVYLMWHHDGHVTLAALTHDGDEAWRREVGPYEENNGFGQSPVVVDGLVIVANDSDAESAIVAFDRLSGDVRWRVPRPSGTSSFATPCVFDNAADTKLLLTVGTAAGLTAFDAATGEIRWEGLKGELPERCVGSPIVAGGLVFVSCGEGGAGKHFIAARPDGAGRGLQEVYHFRKSIPYVPTPVVCGDLLFMWQDRGVVSCHDVATGRQHWKERVGGDFHSSPIRIGNRVFCASRGGEMVVLAADRTYGLLARNDLGEPCHATPAVANGRLYVRTESTLLCVGD